MKHVQVRLDDAEYQEFTDWFERSTHKSQQSAAKELILKGVRGPGLAAGKNGTAFQQLAGAFEAVATGQVLELVEEIMLKFAKPKKRRQAS